MNIYIYVYIYIYIYICIYVYIYTIYIYIYIHIYLCVSSFSIFLYKLYNLLAVNAFIAMLNHSPVAQRGNGHRCKAGRLVAIRRWRKEQRRQRQTSNHRSRERLRHRRYFHPTGKSRDSICAVSSTITITLRKCSRAKCSCLSHGMVTKQENSTVSSVSKKIFRGHRLRLRQFIANVQHFSQFYSSDLLIYSV